MKNGSDILVANFYEWEKPLRGNKIYPNLVDIEPVFSPFYHIQKHSGMVVDDSKIPSLFERLATYTKKFATKMSDPFFISLSNIQIF